MIVLECKFGLVKDGNTLRVVLDMKQRKFFTESVTEDHSLLDKNRGVFKPCDVVLGEELLHNHSDYFEPKIPFDKELIKVIV